MSNEWNLHVNSLQTRLSDLQSTIDSIKSCVERRPGLDAATQAMAALIDTSTQSEGALPEFPTALSRILQDPEIGALLIGPHGDVVLFNVAAENLLGKDYLQEKSTGPVTIQFSIEDKSRRLNADELPWSRVLRGESIPDMRVHVSRTGSSSDLWLNVSATPFRNNAGAVTGAVIFLIDTTEEVQLESSISTLCNTIHDQIAQVGSTHTQLRDLAEKLSNTGLQRIISDSSPGAPPASRAEEDPTRKKSHPRRDERVEQAPSATRNEISGPQRQAFPDSRVIIPPPPKGAAGGGARAESHPSEKLEPAPQAEKGEVDVSSAQVEETKTSPASADKDSAGELIGPPEPPKPAFLEEKPDKPEALRKAPFPMQPSGLAADDEDAEPAMPVHSDVESAYVPEELEAELEKIEEEVLEEPVSAEDHTNDKEDGSVAPYAGLDSSDYDAQHAQSPEARSSGSSDFWMGGMDRSGADAAATRSSAGDEVVDSAKSLFGKFANLTKDSYTEGGAKSDKEPDPALPWPEMVDGQDYGEPLWEEYTHSEEEATPWQKDAVDEPGEEPLPRPSKAGNAPSNNREPQQPVEAEEEAVTETIYEPETPSAESEALEDEPAVPLAEPVAEVQADDSEDFEPLPEASGEFARLDANRFGSHSGEFNRLGTTSESQLPPVEQEDAVAEQISAESESVDFAGIDEEIEVESYVEPIDSNLPGEAYAETSYEEETIPESRAIEAEPSAEETSTEQEAVVAEESVAEPEEVVAEESVAEPEEVVAAEAVAAPEAAPQEPAERQETAAQEPAKSSLKDSLTRKPKTSASYNRLKSLSAAADLDGTFLDEGLTGESQVVDYSSTADTFAPIEGPHRVLVVDDIPVNQKLLLLHLKRLGYEADVASNGQEALDMLAQQEYELILMDCDMPVMSGFEAASRIRSNEAYSHRRVPIIALTSYDREGDKEKCIAAGMDDYITKGASQKELKETIERSIVSAQQKIGEGGSAELDAETDLAPLDISAMLKLYGREEVEEISRLFLSNMGTYIECMQLAIDEKNADSVIHFANAVKGPCAALGMRLMTRLTSDIMAYAEAQDWTQVRVKYMRLKAVFVQTREELKKVCPDDSLLAT